MTPENRPNHFREAGKAIFKVLDTAGKAEEGVLLKMGAGIVKGTENIHSAVNIFTEGDSPEVYRKARLIAYAIGTVGGTTGVAIGLAKTGESLSKSLALGAEVGAVSILLYAGVEFVISKTSNKSSNKQA